jgi:hypothetical protein
MLDRGLVAPGPTGDGQAIHFHRFGATVAGTLHNIEGHLPHHSTPLKIFAKY